MEQVAFSPPPLPPKTRRAPPNPTTVLSSSQDVVFNYATNGLHEGITNSSQLTTKSTGNHVVKIRINPSSESTSASEQTDSSTTGIIGSDILCNNLNNSEPCIRINVNSVSDNEMIQNVGIIDHVHVSSGSERSFFYYSPFNCTIMSSGQVSPSDTLDSGTCSDLDSTPPPLPSKKNKTGVTVTVIGATHKRAASLTDSDDNDNESNISCDSLNSDDKLVAGTMSRLNKVKECKASAFLPQGLLKDIRDRSVKLQQGNSTRLNDNSNETNEPQIDHQSTQSISSIHDNGDEEHKQVVREVVVEECTYEDRHHQRQQMRTQNQNRLTYEADKFIDFHLNEMIVDELPELKKEVNQHEDESFAGFKDLFENEGSSTIRSAKGTVRGVKNRVRAGIATFLNFNDQTKTYKEKDCGKVVVYTTTMGTVRDTYQACMKVKQILRTQLVKFEERDVFMSTDYQAEIRDRMRCDYILVPQVFVDGQHIGDAETIEKLNESGELRRILKPYKSKDACTTCKVCGGYNLLPCPVCNGSKKSVHRNHFTTEFVALKCMNCDEVGLVKCTSCAL